MSNKRKVRFLKDVKITGLSYTTEEDGGAASKKNESYLFKSLNVNEESVDQALEAGSDNTVEKSTQENTKENKMSDEVTIEDLKKQLESMKQELALEKASKSLTKYGFEDEVAVAKAVAQLEQDGQEAILKAFDTLVAQKETKVEELEKSLKDAEKKDQEENPLAKALEQEAGEEGSQEGDSQEPSFIDQIKKYQSK